MSHLFKCLAGLTLAVLLAGCDPEADLANRPVDLGQFKLGHNLAIARKPAVLPGSIKVTEAEWKQAVEGAMEARFGRYKGDRLYHFGMSVDGYFLTSLDAGIPGVPSPKSVLLMTVTIWDDALGRKLNEEVKEISVVSAFGDAGPFPSKKDLLETLSAQAAKSIEVWLVKNPQWFTPPFE